MTIYTPKEIFANHYEQYFNKYEKLFEEAIQLSAYGTLVRLSGLTLEAEGCFAPVGSNCLVKSKGGRMIEAEVVGFGDNKLYLMSTEQAFGLSPGDMVIPLGSTASVPVGDEYLGRVIDGVGKPLDGHSLLTSDTSYPLISKPRNPLEREPIREVLDVGIRAINSLLTVGKGQRLGLFAGSGVGKSILLGMMTRFTKADIVIVGLIGERGREVREFIEENLGEEGMKRAVVVASPADTSPLMRLHAAHLATTLAEYYRDQGHSVLLLMDSLTRYAQAQREIALAVGEPPATKGYPPSVFSKLPKLVERAGNGSKTEGSITAFYTVLSEGDDNQDPIVDASRAILDGHIVLSRRLAEGGHYPAIDLEASLSRVMVNIIDDAQLQAAQQFRALYAKYQENRDLISIGAYAEGSDKLIDASISMMPSFNAFLSQGLNESADYTSSVKNLKSLFQVQQARSGGAQNGVASKSAAGKSPAPAKSPKKK